MPIGVSLTISGLGRVFGGDLGAVVDAARTADAAGIAQVAMPDHVAIGPRTDRYPYGTFPYGPDEPWPEPLTVLAAMAAATSRVRLATAILIAPLRPPLLLAKTTATLDVLSGGRLDLGIGTGWQEEEFAGADFAHRGTVMEDTVRACRALWSDSPASFTSSTVSFDGLHSEPRPVQPGGVPVWFGGAATPRTARRIAELGAGWMPLAVTPDEVHDGLEQIHEACRAVGRDPSGIGVRVSARGDLEDALASLPAFEAAGATLAGFAVGRYAESVDDIGPLCDRLAAAVPD